jgi:hypothetical protein
MIFTFATLVSMYSQSLDNFGLFFNHTEIFLFSPVDCVWSTATNNEAQWFHLHIVDLLNASWNFF